MTLSSWRYLLQLLIVILIIPQAPAAGTWDVWQSWSACNPTCGLGSQTRIRGCLSGNCQPAKDGSENQPCDAGACPGTWSAWSAWTTCSVSCGDGNQDRSRTCTGGTCSGSATENQNCNLGTCPATWSTWTAWTTCSVSCGDGNQDRSRTCTGGTCSGNATENQNCNLGTCPGTWSTWTAWTTCSVSCGDGNQDRNRTCTGGTCSGSATENQNCNLGICPGTWSPWTAWSSCSVSCGGGTQDASRTCLATPCTGNSTDSQTCNTASCPPAGTFWNEWSVWSACSVTCGNGTQCRKRTCSNTGCVGSNNETQLCSETSCPVITNPCETGWYNFQTNCYWYTITTYSWYTGRTMCQGKNANLLSIKSKAENDYISSITPNLNFWAGGDDLDYDWVWRWPDKTPFTYTNWYPYEPNGHYNNEFCLVLTKTHINYQGIGNEFVWNDEPCNFYRGFICKKALVYKCGDPDGGTVPAGTSRSINNMFVGGIAVYSCSTGYELVTGDTTRTCQADQTWSNCPPVCSLIDCGDPDGGNTSIPAGSTRNLGSTLYQGQAVYGCQSGFQNDGGSVLRVCQADKTWSGTPIKCTDISMLPVTTTPTVGPIYLTCPAGYLLTDCTCVPWNDCAGAKFINDTTCGGYAKTGYFIPYIKVTATCTYMQKHNTRLTDYNSTGAASLACPVGTTIVGCVLHSDSMTNTTDYVITGNMCNITGDLPSAWTLVVRCRANYCGDPGGVVYADKTGTEYFYNDTVSYTCHNGYSLQAGHSGDILCQADGTWTTMPVCSLSPCSDPGDIPNASKTGTYKVFSSVTYVCDVGYEFSSPTETGIITCDINQVWSTKPSCPVISCGDPEATPPSFSSRALTHTNYQGEANYTCDVGYEIISGSAYRVCQADKTWSGSQPTCSLKYCGDPGDVNNAVKTGTYYVYDVVTYTCNTGYEISNGVTVGNTTCDVNTVWGALPNCTIITCGDPDVGIQFNGSSRASITSINYGGVATYTCDWAHRQMNGTFTRTCMADKTWSGETLACAKKYCSDPGSISFGSYSGTYYVGDTVQYVCDQGYELDNNHNGSILCNCDFPLCINATWPDLPSCTPLPCSDPGGVTNANQNGTYYFVSFNVTYTADVGYELDGNHSGLITCEPDQTWTAKPTATIISCGNPDPVSIPTASVRNLTHTNYTGQANYVCIAGYEVTAGDTYRECLANKTWSGTSPTCSLKYCGDPGNVTFSTKTGTYYVFDIVTYTCIPGFETLDGKPSGTTTCAANATWSNLPNCTAIDCGDPDNFTVPVGATRRLTTTTYLSLVDYQCQVGYQYTGGDMRRQCLSDKKWTGASPTCTIIPCGDPDPNGIPVGVSRNVTHFNYGGEADYACDENYKVAGGDTNRTCQFNGLWSGTPIDCAFDDCPTPPDIANANKSTAVIFRMNDTVTYTCYPGFWRSRGNYTGQSTCQFGQTWSAQPTCIPASCLTPGGKDYATRTGDWFIYSNVTYTCNTGYEVPPGVSSGNATCQSDLTWTPRPTCSIISCGDPDRGVLTTYNRQTTHFNYQGVTRYECMAGHILMGGNLVRQCQEDKNWSGTQPNCTLVDCGDPKVGSLQGVNQTSLTRTSLGGVVQYECLEGMEIQCGSLQRTCLSAGQWSGNQPSCVPINCGDPDDGHVPDGVVRSGNNHEFGGTVSYTVKDKYNLVSGDLQRTCIANKTWTGLAPVLNRTTCNDPAVVNPLSMVYQVGVNSSNPPTNTFGSTIQYQCQPGYMLRQGTMTRECKPDKTWTGSTPVCEEEVHLNCPGPDYTLVYILAGVLGGLTLLMLIPILAMACKTVRRGDGKLHPDPLHPDPKLHGCENCTDLHQCLSHSKLKLIDH